VIVATTNHGHVHTHPPPIAVVVDKNEVIADLTINRVRG